MIFVVALIGLGVGCSFITIGLSNVNFLSDVEKSSNFIKEEKLLSMSDNLVIDVRNLDDINYIESDISDVRVEIWHSKFYDIDIRDYHNDNKHLIHWGSNYSNCLNVLRSYVKDINNLEFIDYTKIKVNIYASKNNISKLQENLNNYEELEYENEWLEKYASL